MIKYLKNDIVTLGLRLALLYVMVFITQIIFYFYNRNIIGHIQFDEFLSLVHGSLIFDNISILYLNTVFILLSILPFRIRAHQAYQKILFWIYVITNALALIILNIADSVYFHFVLKRFTTEDIHFLNNTNNTQIVLDSIIKNFWLLIVAILLIFLMIYCYRKIKYYPIDIKNNYAYYGINSILFCLIIFLWVGGVRGGYANGFPYTLSNSALYSKTSQKANLILSNPMCIFLTINEQDLDRAQYFSNAELDSIFTANHYPTHSAIHLGNKNIVIFILESFSKEHSKFLCPEIYKNERGYTPFLDSLMRQGYVFQNGFANGRQSIEAMPSIFASIPSYKRAFTLLPESLGKIEALPQMLLEKGYSTSFFCGAAKNSMGFESFASLAGVENSYNKEDYQRENYPSNTNTIEPQWGVFDMPFYNYFADKINTMHQPFFASVFNLTSHPPFHLPADYVDKVPKGHTDLQTCVAYTDMSLAKFFAKVKHTAWFKNTIFVFVADHASAITYADESRTPKGLKAIVLFMYTPDQSLKGLNTQVTQQLDIMPTLLGLIGNQKPYFAMGRDVFNESDRMPIATNFTNPFYQAITDSITIYFDGNTIKSSFYSKDTLQKNNVVIQDSKFQQQAEKQLKAILQTYYNRLRKKDYIVTNQ